MQTTEIPKDREATTGAMTSSWGRRILSGFSLWALSLFLLGLGMKFLMMQRCINPLPYFDQWEAEAAAIYVPYYEHALRIADFFHAQNEHRIFITHVYDLVLLLLNGQWDSQLQMVCNALIHCATIAGFGWLMAGLLGRRYYIFIWIPLAVALMSPFGWENTLWSFQSQFYFLLLFSLLAIWLFGAEPLTPRWRLGVMAAGFALLTMASGLLASVTIAGLAMLEILKKREDWRRHLPTLVVCTALAVVGLLLKGKPVGEEQLHAHSLHMFMLSLGNNLAWPGELLPWMALLNLLPVALLAWVYFRLKERSLPAERMILGIGLFAILQTVATAYARGYGGNPPKWRYMDTLAFLFTANFLSVALLVFKYRKNLRFTPAWYALFAVWLGLCATNLWRMNKGAWNIVIPAWAHDQRVRVETTRAFMASDDEKVFAGHKKLELAWSYTPELVFLLRSQDIRPILPACVRDPLKVVPKDDAPSTFVPNGCRLTDADPPAEHCVGSYSATGAAARGAFESAPIRSSLPYLEIPVAGDLGDAGLKLELVELKSGKTFQVKPARTPGGKWLNAYVKTPATEFKIVARDESATGWFAFKAPREMGRLSFWAMRVIGIGKQILVGGLVILCIAFGLFCFQCRCQAEPSDS